mgnify:CR=1 FL=1
MSKTDYMNRLVSVSQVTWGHYADYCQVTGEAVTFEGHEKFLIEATQAFYQKAVTKTFTLATETQPPYPYTKYRG